MTLIVFIFFFFFFNDTATTEIYTLSLHDALPISGVLDAATTTMTPLLGGAWSHIIHVRSEEHTSELQSHSDLVCRLLLEKKKKKKTNNDTRRIVRDFAYIKSDTHND